MTEIGSPGAEEEHRLRQDSMVRRFLVGVVATAALILIACSASTDESGQIDAQPGLPTDSSDATVTDPAPETVVTVGSNVGDYIPDFYIRNSEFAKVTSEELLASGRPTFFYFFTTW